MFVELKCKTNFSFLRGASHSSEYVLKAAELAMPAIGISDLNGVYSLPRAFETIQDQALKLKLISATEIVLKDHPPITLIAQTRSAYGLMCRIISQVHAGKEKGKGFITLSELADLVENHQGGKALFCIPEVKATTNFPFLTELFPDSVFAPLCKYLDGLDDERTHNLIRLAQQFKIPIVATNDVHYHIPQRRQLQDCMTCIREGVTLESAGFHLFGNEERYLKSALQMRSLFKDLPQAIANTVAIAERCTFSLSELKYTYPQEFIPPGHSAKSYLAELVFKGAYEIYRGIIPAKVDAQIRRELAFFEKRGDEHYFLTVQDIVRFARESNIICQGRGSAANSIVCYVLGITSVDPVQMNLLFDRFMNDGRKEPPDIDVDFEHDRREEVIQYIYKRFGRDRAAMVAAIRTYRSKSAFIELSKAVGVEVGTMSAGELDQRFDELAKDLKYRRPQVERLVNEMKTFPRHISIHTGGFVLSNDPLLEICPIEPARMPGRTIIQWDKDDLETLGLMKVDILSIGFLTALHKATDLAGINWRDIPPEDPETYKMIGRAATHGTFQIESRAQMAMLVQTLPQNYYDLVVEVALIRPSPTVGGMVQPYLKGLLNSRKGIFFKSGHQALDAILGRTFGVPIFQEQVMQISIEVGGFTPAEADQLRRSLGKQRSAQSVDAMGKKLYQALIDNNIPNDFADRLFNFVKGYAHYGFPESHAASYASIAYKSAYMKCHYPAELLVGLINSQPMGFYSVDTLINEAKRNGVIVLPIDPNISHWEALLTAPKTVRMGFSNLRKVRKEDIKAMIQERKNQPFKSIEDFIARNRFGKDVLENLSFADVFSSFGLDRRHSFWQSVEFTQISGEKTGQQLSLFNENAKFSQIPDQFQKMSLLEEIRIDYRKKGYSLHGNIMKGLRLEHPDLPKWTSLQLSHLPRGRSIQYAGVLMIIQRPPPAKGTAFITLEDEFGSVNLVLKSATFDKFQDLITGSRFLIVSGVVQKKGLGTSLLVSAVKSFRIKEGLCPLK